MHLPTININRNINNYITTILCAYFIEVIELSFFYFKTTVLKR